MARSTRQNSESGYLHIIVRGNGKQILFEDTQDFRHFLNRLKRYCLQTDVRICAYCLMDNHVHLLARGDSSSMVLLMRKLGVSYSVYYNKKNELIKIKDCFNDLKNTEVDIINATLIKRNSEQELNNLKAISEKE